MEGEVEAWNSQAQQAGEEEDVNPLNLASLFGGEQDCSKQGGPAGVQRSVAVAGAGLDDEFELKKLQVFVRIRPSLTKDALRWDSENCIHATSKCSIAIAPPETSQAYKNGDRGQAYSFSHVFDEGTSQQGYFEGTAAPLVRDLLRNPQHNSVMMAYGITAAGKTYTIEGTAAEPGVMPRALEMLFQGLEDHVEAISVRVTYYEVYNEQVYDLVEDAPLGPGLHRAALKLKEDNQGRVFVAGLTEVEVTSATEALRVLRRGSKQRQRAETGLNYNSSRSHSIFTVMLYQRSSAACAAEDGCEQAEDAEEQEERLGRLSFVDLAGSERAQRTGNVGVRLKESVAINSSLMTLGRCLEALRWNQQHKNTNQFKVVPFRESKVTHLFRDALHGWGQVVLSVNVSPCAKDYDETSHVLKYAALATQIGTIQQAEAPRRVVKAVSPAIKKVKRKAGLPPEARGRRVKIKRAKNSPPKAAVEEEEQQQPPASPMPAEGTVVEGGAGDGSSEYDALQRGCEGEEEEQQGVEDAAEAAGLQYAGSPATPLEDDGEDGAFVAELQAQVQGLVAQLQKAEERCVMVETEVREEVAQEMEQLMRKMEANYKERLAAELCQLEAKLPTLQQAAADVSMRGKGRACKDSELASAAQWEALVAVAEQRAAKLQEQLDALSAELASSQQRADKLQAALDQSAVQQERIAQLEEQLAQLQWQAAASQQLSAAVEQLRAELEQSKAQEAALQAELEGERQRTAALAAEVVLAQQEAARCAETTLQEELTQVEANRAMEVEMLEEQLHRAKKDNDALRQRLDAAMATLVTMASPSVPLMQRMAQACPAGNGRGAGGTPHDVALTRARQAAAAEELEQAGALSSVAATTVTGKLLRGKASGQASRLGVGASGHLLASRPVPAAAEGDPGGPSQALNQDPAAPAQLGKADDGGAATAAAAGGGTGQSTLWDGNGHLPEIPEEPAGQPAIEEQHAGQGACGDEWAAHAAAAEPKRARRATRASAPPPAPLAQQQDEGAAVAVQQPQPAGQEKRRPVRRPTKAAVPVLAPIIEAAHICTDAAEPAKLTALAQAAGDGVGPQPAAAKGPLAVEEQHAKGGRKGGRRRAPAAKPLPEPTPEAEPHDGIEVGAGGEHIAPGGAEQEASAAVQQQPARARQGRRGRRTTTSILAGANEAVPAAGSEAAAEATQQGQAQAQARANSDNTATASSRRASSIPSRKSDKENESEPGAASKQAVGKAAVPSEPIAEEPEEEAAAEGAPGAAMEQQHKEESCPLQPPGKRRRKLLPVKTESEKLKTALGEWNGDSAMDAAVAAAVPARRPRRQTTFFRM